MKSSIIFVSLSICQLYIKVESAAYGGVCTTTTAGNRGDCTDTHGACSAVTGGTCGCATNYVPSATNICLLKAGQIGCTANADCTTNSQCSTDTLRICTCSVNYVQQLTGLCLLKAGQTTCSVASDCTVNTACTSGTCTCFANYVIQTSGVCLLKAGQTCTADAQCTANSVCSTGATRTCTCITNTLAQANGLCAINVGGNCSSGNSANCKSGTICESDVCKLYPGGDCTGSNAANCKYGTTCESGLCKLNIGGDCSGPNSANCKSGTTCDSNMCRVDILQSCASLNVSNCKTGLACDTTDSKCRYKVSSVCVTGVDRCVSGATCATTTDQCSCNSAAYTANAETGTCDRKVGQACTMDEECTTNSACPVVTRICTCATGYIEQSSGLCLLKAGQIGCTADADCTVNSQCLGGIRACTCYGNYVHQLNGLCLLKAGQTGCTADSDCTMNSYCSIDAPRTCTCSSCYVQQLSGLCLLRSGSTCSPSVQCTENSYCSNITSTCMCSTNYVHYGTGPCLLKVGQACTMDGECTTNSACSSNTSVCTCLTGYIQQSSGLCLLKVGQACVGDGKCTTNSVCSLNICTCLAGYIQQSSGLCYDVSTTTTDPFTTLSPPCVMRPVDLNDVCGADNVTWGFCTTGNSSCAFPKGVNKGNRTCQCIHGSIAVVDEVVNGTRSCREAPTELFKNEYNANLKSDDSNNTLVLNASLDTGGILMNPDKVNIRLYPSNSFLYIPDKSNQTFSILTHGNIPALDKIYTFFIEAEMTYGDTIVTDITYLTVNVTRAFPIPAPLRGAFVVDGTRNGSIIYDLSNDLGNIDGVDLSLNSTGSLFRLSKQDIVCAQDINFADLRASPSIGHLVTLNILKGQTLVLVLKVAIIVNKHSIQVNENSQPDLAVAEFDSILESYTISLTNPSDTNFLKMSVNQTHVQLSRSPDYETTSQRSFTFHLSIAFRNNSLMKTIVAAEVIVVDINDVAPAFVTNSYFFSTQSGAPTGTILGLLEIVDPDTVPTKYTYQIETTLYQSYFQVQPKTGAIVAIQDLKDLNSKFSFSVSVNDGLSKSQTPALVTVVLSEIKPNLVMVGSNLSASVLENKPSGTIVINASLTNYTGYQLLPADVIRFFIIDSQTGLVTTTAVIDREVDVPPKVFSAIAYSKDKPCEFKIVGNISVEIVDENDNPPVFTDKGIYKTRLVENSTAGTSVFRVQATDIDKGENSTITYYLSGTNSGAFQINSQSGEITVASSGQDMLDRETADTLLVTVTAVDGGQTLKQALRKTATATLTITLMDINDNSPQFNRSQYTFSFFENQPADFLVGSVSATDRDINENGAIWYSLSSDGRGYFWLTPTGELRTKLSIDREKDMSSQFNLTIIAYDNGSPIRSGSTMVIVNVKDVNDMSPVFQESKGYVDIYEGSGCVNFSNIQVIALDGDEGLNGQVSYALDKSAEFVINSSTGIINCKSPGLDYENETQRDITIHVIAFDKGTPPLNGTTTVRVILKDVNDNSPVFVGLPYNVSIPSSSFQIINTTVYVVNVLDSDSGQYGYVDLKLYSKGSEGADLLWVDNKGIIRVKSSQTFPAGFTYVRTFIIEAADRGQPAKTSQADLIITVDTAGKTDVKFSNSDFTLVVEEGSCTPHSKLIGKLEATVTPGFNATYTLATLDFPFSINSTTAEINCLGPLDRETKDTYQMLANATAATSHSYAIVTVTVADVNDNAPQFSSSEVQLTTEVVESAPLGSFIIVVNATDPDARENGTIVFSILETNTRFRINETDGRLYVDQNLDRETEPNYKVTVMARDKGTPSLSTTTRVSITLLDVNDNAPVFNTSFAQTFRVSESASVSSEVGRVQATDKDFSENGTVTYSIVNTTECPFKISDGGTTGVLSVITALDYERERQYRCTVQAKDSATSESARLSSNLTVTIQVTDVNDNSPIINDIPPFVSFNVSRDTVAPFDIISKLNASDADEGVNAEIVFSLSVAVTDNPNTNNYFQVDPVTGKLSVSTSLQYLESVNLTIIAQDRGTPPLSTSVMIEILILDNNTAPLFNQSLYSYSVTEEDPSFVKELITINATDRDDNFMNCNCTYAILSANSSTGQNVINYFSIVSSSGAISLLKVIDREQLGDTITVKLKATDKGIPAKSTTTLLNITIVDINDNRPQFGQLFYEATIPKAKCKAGSQFFSVNAIDADKAPYNVISYSLIPQSSVFGLKINETNATLTLTNSLCAADDNNKQFTVIIIASDDQSKPNVSTTIVITVNLTDYNLNAPNFQKVKYHANVPFTTHVGTTVQLLDFFATDNDGNNITYAINDGNLRCPETIFIIDNVTGVITVNKELQQISVDYFNLIVTATDSGDFDPKFTKTGTTTVEINITDTTKFCYNPTEVAKLSSDASKFQLFQGLFIALAILLGIAIITSVLFLYKWRVANSTKRQSENDRNSFHNIFGPSSDKTKDAGEGFSSGSGKKTDTSGMPPRLPRRDAGQDTTGDSGFGVSGQSMDSAGYLAPSESAHSGGQRQFLSGDYTRFSSGIPEDVDNENTGYLSPTADLPPPAAHHPTTYLTAAPDTSGRPGMLPRIRLGSQRPESDAYLHGAVNPNDIETRFPPPKPHLTDQSRQRMQDNSALPFRTNNLPDEGARYRNVAPASSSHPAFHQGPARSGSRERLEGQSGTTSTANFGGKTSEKMIDTRKPISAKSRGGIGSEENLKL